MSTLLLVDDDPEFRQIIVPALEAKGHRVLQANRGAEATAILERGDIDLVIVDGLLPDIDGPSWIERQRARGRTVPMVFVSAFWRDLGSFQRLTRDLKVNLVVHKPVTPQVFAEQVESQLSGQAAPVPARAEPTVEEVFRDLQAEYARELPAKVRELAHAVHQARSQPDSPVALGEARARAHRLRGTAGSYGFRVVGEAAGKVEEGLARLRRAEDWPEIEAALSAAVAAADSVARAVEGGPPARCVTGRLLVVGPDPELLSMVETRARQQLLEVDAFENVSQALDRARAAAPDAVIVDLPPEDAAALARSIRSLPGCEGVPIGFVGTASSPLERVAAVHAGASLYLARPVTSDALDDAARQLVAMRQAGQARVLVLDDDPVFTSRVVTVLRRQEMIAGAAHDPLTILEALEEWQPELLLLDVIMPGISGFDVCRMLRATPRWQELPIILVSAQMDADARLAAFQAGCDDVLPKPVLDEELLARVRVRVERLRLLRERHDKDALTGLLLRRPFVEGMRTRILEATRHGRTLAVALLDLDNFKAINDSRGHLAGDAVLAALGRLLSRRFRAEDLRARWGGEEFMLAFPGETAASVEGAMRRLLDEFRSLELRGDDGLPFQASFSAGLATFPRDGATLEALLKVADRRLFVAKASGRASIVCG